MARRWVVVSRQGFSAEVVLVVAVATRWFPPPPQPATAAASETAQRPMSTARKAIEERLPSAPGGKTRPHDRDLRTTHQVPDRRTLHRGAGPRAAARSARRGGSSEAFRAL